MAKSEWVRVRSESELRPGIFVEVRNCIICGNRERVFLSGPRELLPDYDDGSMGMAWPHVGGSCDNDNLLVLDWAIAEGRLYRLRDLDEADETTEAVKELEVVR